ncbi:hypothetical protein D082_28540 [Synechocystis sp. PCC 6714]|nr:hypothetical protein D082_28540 [Synechocystis sp. PCC 6714]
MEIIGKIHSLTFLKIKTVVVTTLINFYLIFVGGHCYQL